MSEGKILTNMLGFSGFDIQRVPVGKHVLDTSHILPMRWQPILANDVENPHQFVLGNISLILEREPLYAGNTLGSFLVQVLEEEERAVLLCIDGVAEVETTGAARDGTVADNLSLEVLVDAHVHFDLLDRGGGHLKGLF